MEYKILKDINFVTAKGWMRRVLHLSGDELWVFAIIYGITQDGRSEYHGGIRYIMEWLDCSDKTASKYLNQLADKGLLIKRVEIINNVKFCNYAVNLSVLPKNFPYPTEESSVMNINNIETNSRESNTRARMCKPTVDQIAAYCAERRNDINAQEFYDWYEANGWKVGRNPMKDWKAAVRTWESKRSKEAKPQQPKNAFDIMYAKLKARHPEMNNQTPFPIDEQ